MNQIFGKVDEEEIPKALRNKKNDKKNGKKMKKKKKNIAKKVIITLCVLFILGAGSLGFLLYGPYHGFRDWLITTAMTTMSHQWIAYLFYSPETIDEVMANNKVDEIVEDTDIDAITIGIEEKSILKKILKIKKIYSKIYKRRKKQMNQIFGKVDEEEIPKYMILQKFKHWLQPKLEKADNI